MISVRPKRDTVEAKDRAHQSVPVPTFHWAATTGDLKFIDDDIADDACVADNVKKVHLPSPRFFAQRFRSHSIGGHLNNLDVVSITASNFSEFHRIGSLREAKKRMMLSQSFQKSTSSRSKLISCGKSKSLDSGSIFDASFSNDGIFMKRSPPKSPKKFHKTRPLLLIDKRHPNSLGMHGWDVSNGHLSSDRTTSNSSEDDSSSSSRTSSSPILKSVHFDELSFLSDKRVHSPQTVAAAEPLTKNVNGCSVAEVKKPTKKSKQPIVKSVKDDKKTLGSKAPPPDLEPAAFGGAKSKLSNSNGLSSPKLSRTLSPSCMRRALAGASSSILNSPLLNRRRKTVKTEISDDDNSGATSDDVITRDFKDLGSLQKARLKQKVRSDLLAYIYLHVKASSYSVKLKYL